MHWLHSLDQMVYRLGAACFTVTELARLLYELREDRKHAMASAHAESLRSSSRFEQSRKVLSNVHENSTNTLRAKATTLEDGARYLIALPAYEAARLELLLIDTLIAGTQPKVYGTIPFTFHECQRIENLMATYWRGYISVRTYGQLGSDVLSDILIRGHHEPDYTGVTCRDTFLEKFNTSSHMSLSTEILDGLYASAIQVLENSEILKSYTMALELDYGNEAFLGILPTGHRTLSELTSAERLRLPT